MKNDAENKCGHAVIEHFCELDELFESDSSRNSEFFFKMTLHTATYYNHTQLITRMLSDPRCQLNSLPCSMLPLSAQEEIIKPACYLKRVKFIKTVLSIKKVGILTKL